MNKLNIFALLAFGLISTQGLAAATDKKDLVERGRYLATAADCTACHTIPGGKPFAGGLPFATPEGTLYSPNITPDKKTGIGEWSEEEFIRALHEGKGKDGENLYPAFPYTSYTLLKIEDVKAIRAYLFSLPAVNQPNRDNSMMFPFNQRWGLIAWKKANFTPGRMKVDNNKDQAWNRGAYLVEALGHCGECHTPRNITMGLKQGERYSGASLEGWTVFNITSDKVAGIGNWSKQEIVQYLRSGRVAFKAQAAGPMAEVIENSTRHLSDGDLDAMAHYIATLEAKNPNDETHSRSELGTISNSVDGLRGRSFEWEKTNGARLYLGNCATCHSYSGAGSADNYYPSLMNNSAVGASTTNNLIKTILDGVSRHTNDTEVFMPGFANKLSDEQISSLANFVLKQFGRPKLTVGADGVKKLRIKQ